MNSADVLELLSHQNSLLEQQILATRRLEWYLSQMLAILPKVPPDYQHPLTSFLSFDWASIGARVIESDSSGAALVSWGGHIYARRSPQNKFGEAIWFSRCTGKSEDGSNRYERLITFKRVNSTVEPIPERVSRHLVVSRVN